MKNYKQVTIEPSIGLNRECEKIQKYGLSTVNTDAT